MPLVKCANCGERLDRDDAIRVGIQSYHPEHPYPKAKDLNTGRTSIARRPMKRKAPHQIAKAMRKWITKLDGGKCRYCGTWASHIHHVVYRSQGGPDEISNLITLCQEHHDLVHSDKPVYMPLCLGVLWLRNVEGDRAITIPVLRRRLNGSAD